MFSPEPREVVTWESRIKAITEALPHIEETITLLRQPFETDEIAFLEDLLSSLREERSNLETLLLGIEEDH